MCGVVVRRGRVEPRNGRRQALVSAKAGRRLQAKFLPGRKLLGVGPPAGDAGPPDEHPSAHETRPARPGRAGARRARRGVRRHRHQPALHDEGVHGAPARRGGRGGGRAGGSLADVLVAPPRGEREIHLVCDERRQPGRGRHFALLALLSAGRDQPRKPGLRPAVIMILIGAALLYGDGIITPAISVLGAAEGFKDISHDIHFSQTEIVWIACGILAGFFWFQHKGTKSIGNVFGPVMLVWFATIATVGAWHIKTYPGVWRALNPAWGFALLRHSPIEISALLGAVVLTITGAEALYADMGHFGRKFIAVGWYGAA